jgi:hypothetical protein
MINRLIEYLDKNGCDYTINRNPSEEEINRIKTKIADNEQKMFKLRTIIKGF